MGAATWRWVLRAARFSGCGGGALAVLRRPSSSGARASSSFGSAVSEAGAARRAGPGAVQEGSGSRQAPGRGDQTSFRLGS